MKKRKCPKQQAFQQQLNYLMNVRDDVYWRRDLDMEGHFSEEYEKFIDLWCPTTIYEEEKNERVDFM